MSPETPTLNASQAVERIREIIVGRHLERLEQRVARLEASDAPVASYPELDERVLMTEARVEALQDSVNRLTDHTRDELERRNYLQREEIQRLAQQIQHATAARATADPGPAMQQLEQKLGGWLNSWKTSLQQHLDSRDHRIAGHIETELKTLKTSIDERFADFEGRFPDNKQLELRFRKIADAARALAESVTQIPPLPLADDSPL